MSRAERTATTFRDKWSRNPDLAFRQTLDEQSEIFRWIVERNGFRDAEGLEAFLAPKRRMLDAGCGNGRVTALLRRHANPAAEIVAIDLTSADVAARNLEGAERVSVHARDLLDDLSDLGEFDFIYCQEVLHHTSDPARAFRNLAARLTPGGDLAIYVYRRKAPVREFTDDFVRERISRLDYDDALEQCRRVAELGKALADLDVTVRVPEIEVLGIEAGEYDVQRFVYHHFMKCFWNDELDGEANAAVNFDWYHPQLSTRHTLDECREWAASAGLMVEHEHVDPYGITLHARSPR
jgi:SAM-dependent methyltransferase